MKIKTILLLLISMFVLSGCTNIKNMSIDEITNILTHEEKRPNNTKTGFKYYLPSGMTVKNSGVYYEVIKSNRNYYYLYVDMISYTKKTPNAYKVNENAYYSKIINNGDKYGYLEINLKENNQYLIEIMYNYAKIEVMVDDNDINSSLLHAVNILNSVEYNMSVIENLLSDDTLNYTEEEFNLFETGVDNSNTLEYIEEDVSDEIPEEEIKDTDYVS